MAGGSEGARERTWGSGVADWEEPHWSQLQHDWPDPAAAAAVRPRPHTTAWSTLPRRSRAPGYRAGWPPSSACSRTTRRPAGRRPRRTRAALQSNWRAHGLKIVHAYTNRRAAHSEHQLHT